jgi:hypothetical protein
LVFLPLDFYRDFSNSFWLSNLISEEDWERSLESLDNVVCLRALLAAIAC